MKLSRKKSESALTLIEVLVVVAVLAVLAALLLPATARLRVNAQRSFCADNLHDVSFAFRQFAVDYTNFPMALSTNLGGTEEYGQVGQLFHHFQALSNDLRSPKRLICPSDTRLANNGFASLSNANISYFVGLDANESHPWMFLIGDRNLTNETAGRTGILDIRSNSPVGWTSQLHNECGNIALADGSLTYVLSTLRLRECLGQTGVATNRLALPLD